MSQLSRITVFPIKSLDGKDLQVARILPSGALMQDRRWAIVDEDGAVVTGKRTANIHAIRADYGDDFATVRLRHGADAVEFSLIQERDNAALWLSRQLGLRCRLIENADRGFPDDQDAAGPTVVGAASLAEVASWYDGMTAADARRRLRTNFELSDCNAFWEDRLIGDNGAGRRFAIGDAVLLGRRICQRCVVPSRDPESGEVIPGFAKTFAERRRPALSALPTRDQFDHFYRIAVNTSLDSVHNRGTIRVGDAVRLID